MKESVWRNRLATVAMFVTAVVGLAALAGFAAPWGTGFELASHFRVQYFWGLLIGASALVVARSWKSAVVAGLLLFIHLGQLWPFYAPRRTPRPDSANLRVMSFNVHSVNRRHADVLQLVRQWSPDVVVFLEVNTPWAEALTALDHDWHHSRTWATAGNFGIALYSRIPLDDGRIEFLSNGCPAVVACLEAGGTPVTIFGAHPFPPTVGGAESRDRQLAALAELIVASPGEKIVVGDLNTSSWSPVFSRLASRTGLRDSRSGLGVQPSWPSGLPQFLRIPIDHCLVSSGIQVVARRIGADVGSDHLPVLADLAVGGSQPP